jgi:hypothetical protein
MEAEILFINASSFAAAFRFSDSYSSLVLHVTQASPEEDGATTPECRTSKGHLLRFSEPPSAPAPEVKSARLIVSRTTRTPYSACIGLSISLYSSKTCSSTELAKFPHSRCSRTAPTLSRRVKKSRMRQVRSWVNTH